MYLYRVFIIKIYIKPDLPSVKKNPGSAPVLATYKMVNSFHEAHEIRKALSKLNYVIIKKKKMSYLHEILYQQM